MSFRKIAELVAQSKSKEHKPVTLLKMIFLQVFFSRILRFFN